LDEVYQLPIQKALDLLEDIVITEKSIKDLIKLLLDSRIKKEAKWPKIQKILKNIEGDPEQIRYAVLSSVNKKMLGPYWSRHDANVGNCFLESFMYTGMYGLTGACFMCCFDLVDDDIPF
jgi:hypothetical protein